MLTIEKNIPIPAKGRGGAVIGEFTKTALALDIGDSFFVEWDQKKCSGTLWHAKKAGMKFTTRKEGEGTRIWRVA